MDNTEPKKTLSYDWDVLRHFCVSGETDLGKTLVKKYGFTDYGRYWFKDNKSSVLAVCHIDHVGGKGSYRQIKHNGDYMVFSQALDDRLGVFALCELLPQWAINCDLLVTTDEESCDSSAAEFAEDVEYHNKSYNWIVGLDRAGIDAVLYDFGSKSWRKALRQFWELGRGSYSDICELGNLGIQAVNVGIGYRFQHSPQCWASIQDLTNQLSRLRMFYNLNKDRRFEFTKPVETISESWADIRRRERYGYSSRDARSRYDLHYDADELSYETIYDYDADFNAKEAEKYLLDESFDESDKWENLTIDKYIKHGLC